jgi:hypothetical protein
VASFGSLAVLLFGLYSCCRYNDTTRLCGKATTCALHLSAAVSCLQLMG